MFARVNYHWPASGQDVGAISSFFFPILGVVTVKSTFCTLYLEACSRLKITSKGLKILKSIKNFWEVEYSESGNKLVPLGR